MYKWLAVEQGAPAKLIGRKNIESVVSRPRRPKP